MDVYFQTEAQERLKRIENGEDITTICNEIIYEPYEDKEILIYMISMLTEKLNHFTLSMAQPKEQAPAQAEEHDEFDDLDEEWLTFKNHAIEMKEKLQKKQNVELYEAQQEIEALKATIRILQKDLAAEEERNDDLQHDIGDLREKIIDLQDKIKELEEQKTKIMFLNPEEVPEEPQPAPAVPTPAVPAPAAPNRPTTLRKWVFCQYLLAVDPTKKYYNTFRNKWIKLVEKAHEEGGDFLNNVEDINHRSVTDLDAMIDFLEDLYYNYEYDEVQAAIEYLRKAKEDYPNA